MDDLVAELRKQAHICQTSKAIGSITKDRCEAAMTEAAVEVKAPQKYVDALRQAWDGDLLRPQDTVQIGLSRW